MDWVWIEYIGMEYGDMVWDMGGNMIGNMIGKNRKIE